MSRETRRGRWVRKGDHPTTPGWHLDNTTLVLDYDPRDRGSTLQGAWILYVDGIHVAAIDHYFDGARAFVEEHEAAFRNGRDPVTGQQRRAH